jgi:hypothetical protein
MGKSENGFKNKQAAGHWWLTPETLATQEAEVRRIVVKSQPGEIVLETLSQKSLHKRGWWSGPRCRP